MKNCTCGVKFTGGLHSTWCDTLAPDEPEPDTLPSPWHGYDPSGNTAFLKQWLKTHYGVTLKPSTTGLQPPVKPAPKATPVYIVKSVSPSGAMCQLDDGRLVRTADLTAVSNTGYPLCAGDMVVESPPPKP